MREPFSPVARGDRRRDEQGGHEHDADRLQADDDRHHEQRHEQAVNRPHRQTDPAAKLRDRSKAP